MKRLSFLLTILFYTCAANTQTPNKQLPTTSKPQTIKTTGTNKVIPKLPDLRITSATVAATSTGGDSYKFTITCTIKNEGTVAINYADVGTRGRYNEEANRNKDLSFNSWRPGCGSGLGALSSNASLAPGASATMQFYCFNQVLIRSNSYVYALFVETKLQELASENNRVDLPIVFQ